MPVFISVLNYLSSRDGLFTLVEMDLGTDSDLDSKPNGYIVLCRICLHFTDSDSDPCSLSLCRTRIGVRVRTHIRVRLRQCK